MFLHTHGPNPERVADRGHTLARWMCHTVLGSCTGSRRRRRRLIVKSTSIALHSRATFRFTHRRRCRRRAQGVLLPSPVV